MSFNVSGMQEYVEQNANEIATKAITEASTMKLLMQNKAVQFGKGSNTVTTMTNSVTFSDGSACGRVEDAATTFSQRKISYVPLKVNKTYCYRNLYSTVLATALSKGQSNESMDSTTWAAVAEDIAKNISFEYEKLTWQGDTTLTGNLSWYDGFVKLITGAGTTLTLTGSDIIAKLQSAASQIPINLKSQEDFRIFIGQDTMAALELALYNKNLYNPGGLTNIPGTTVKLEVVSGLNGTNKIIGSRISNLRAIMDEAGEETKAVMFFKQDTQESLIDFYFGGGVQIVFPSEAYYASVA